MGCPSNLLDRNLVGQDKRDGATWWPSCCLHIVLDGTTSQSFDPLTGLIQHQRAGPGGAVASFDYQFDTIGNLSSRSDNSQPFTERLCYDALNRLTGWNIGATCSGGKTAGYDAIGNITSKSDAGSYAYGTAPHQVLAITGTVDGLVNPQYSYDANGNLTCVSTGSGCSGTVGRTIMLTAVRPSSRRSSLETVHWTVSFTCGEPLLINMAQSPIRGSTSLQLTYYDSRHRL